MGSEFSDSCPYKKENGHRECQGRTRLECCVCKPKNVKVTGNHHQILKEARKDPEVFRKKQGSIPRVFRENVVLLHFRILAPTTEREYISSISSHPVLDHLL